MRPQVLAAGAVILAIGLIGGFGIGRLKPKSATPPPAANQPTMKKALYWYDPMSPTQHFDKPGKSPFMDMQLVPKYADDASAPGVAPGVSIDPARVQSLGVRYATVTRADLAQAITAPGSIDFNQRDVAIVQAKSAGFVQRVYAHAPGDVIRAGAPLADVLVPEWAGAQTEFLAVRKIGDPGLTAAARQRLGLLGMSAATIAEMERTGKPQTFSTISTPAGGVIKTLSIRAGMTVSAGQTLAEVNGIGTVWVNASVPAMSANAIAPGQSARVTIAGDEARPINGRVSAILPEVAGDSRTLQVRVELPNPGSRLRPGEFATVTFAGARKASLVVPSEAVIRTGKRALVMLALPGGRFQPAEVQLGAEAGDQTEILSGLSEGEKIVASGQFLIDSEASLSGIDPRRSTPPQSSPSPPTLYEGHGRIERLDASAVTLSHAPVPAIPWPAMTMTFRLADPAMARGLKVGDQVRFAFDHPTETPTVRSLTKDAAP